MDCGERSLSGGHRRSQSDAFAECPAELLEGLVIAGRLGPQFRKLATGVPAGEVHPDRYIRTQE